MKDFLPLAFVVVLVLGCGKKTDPSPDSNQKAYFPKQITGGSNNLDVLEYDASGRVTKINSGMNGSYFAWRYEVNKIVGSFYSGTSKKLSEDDVYSLNATGQLVEKNAPYLVTARGTFRHYNIIYDAEGHVLSYETETKSDGVKVSAGYRYEYTWQNGNVVRRKTFDRLQNSTLINDRTLEYDLTKTNTLFPQALPNRFHFGGSDPNLNCGLLFGKGNQNVVVKDFLTNTPTRFITYLYEFDAENRIKSISVSGDKFTITY